MKLYATHRREFEGPLNTSLPHVSFDKNFMSPLPIPGSASELEKLTLKFERIYRKIKLELNLELNCMPTDSRILLCEFCAVSEEDKYTKLKK